MLNNLLNVTQQEDETTGVQYKLSDLQACAVNHYNVLPVLFIEFRTHAHTMKRLFFITVLTSASEVLTHPTNF